MLVVIGCFVRMLGQRLSLPGLIVAASFSRVSQSTSVGLGFSPTRVILASIFGNAPKTPRM